MANTNEIEIEFDDDFDFSTPTPPKIKSKGAGKKPVTRRATRPTLVQIEKSLALQLNLLGVIVSGWDSYDGSLLITNADEISASMVELAKANPKVKIVLENLMAAGAWTGVVAVVGTKLAIPIAVHHNLLPTGINTMVAALYEPEIPIRESKKNAPKPE